MAVVAENAHESVIEIDETSLGGGNENAFLNLLEKRPELVLGLAPAREVLKDMNCAAAPAFRVMKSGIGGQKISAEGWIGLLGFSGGTFAVRTASPGGATLTKHVAHEAPSEGVRFDIEPDSQRAIGADNASIERMDKDQIINGIEGIEPLPARSRGIFEQAHVLDRQPQEIGDVDEVMLFFGLELTRAGRADSEKPERSLFSKNPDQDQR